MRIRTAFTDGVRQFTEHPQLWLTVVVAFAIIGGFVFTAYRFSGIALDAHERLVNVRVGSLQDAFVPLASTLSQNPDLLRSYMLKISQTNQTIQDFHIATRNNDQWTIAVSSSKSAEGTTLLGYDLLLSLAEADPGNSFTIEEARGSERFFVTVRSIPSFRTGSTTVRAAAITRQTLSEADTRVAIHIGESVAILTAILLVLLYLFFRHARIIDYTVLYRRLKEVDQLKDDFISMASHELRTPLTAIRGYADALKTTPRRSVKDKETLTHIDSSALSLDQLIADILDVARLQEGRLTYNIKEENPREIIGAICEELQPVAGEKNIGLTCDVTNEARIRVDSKRFRQIFVNLIGNAVKYTQHGEVRVTSAVEKSIFTIRVSDTGLGMSADEQRHLFEKFYRSSDENVRAQRGTGLGLWITKQLIEAMGGTVAVESIKGVGSHFVVSFPLAKRP